VQRFVTKLLELLELPLGRIVATRHGGAD
jgi:hypothetical protein